MITNIRNLPTTFIVLFSRNKIFGKNSKISFQLLQECENLILELAFAFSFVFAAEQRNYFNPKSRGIKVKKQTKLKNCSVTFLLRNANFVKMF